MRISDWSSDVCSSDLGFSRDIPFVLQCNTPMRLAMVSQNGGLKVASAPPEGFTNLLDYTVTLYAVGTGGTSIVASCSASSLAAAAIRSEEHTSELQSLMRISYAVFCLTKNSAS